MSRNAGAFERAARAAQERHADHAASQAAAPGPAARAPRAGSRDGRYSLAMGALVWTLVVMMIVPEGFNYNILAASSYGPSSGGLLTRLLWLTLLAGGTLLMLVRLMPTLAVLRSLNVFLLLFAALALSSVVWSIEPTVTVRRLIRLVTVLAVSIAFAVLAWHRTRFQDVVRPILTLVLFGSIVFGLLAPSYATHQESAAELAGAWRGLTNHKNTLGALSAICLIFWVHAWLSREVRWLVCAAGMGIAVTCLLLSRSATALVTSAFVTLFLLVLLRSPPAVKRHMPWVVGLFIAVLSIYSLAILNIIPGLATLFDPITALTGKDLTFTGRSAIWEIIMEHVRFAPWFGTGFGAYWVGPVPASPSYVFVLRTYFYPGSAHNGYLEMVNDLGMVGLACLAGYLLTHVAQSLRLLRVDRPQAALYLALFFQQAISNLSETHWLNVMNVDFVIVTLATTALARGLLQEKLRRRYGEVPVAVRPMRQPLVAIAPVVARGGAVREA